MAEVTQVDKAAVKEMILRAKYRHVPRAKSDSPMLLAKHEDIKNSVAIELAALVDSHNVNHNLMGTNWKTLQ